MTVAAGGRAMAALVDPASLLAALRADAGGIVDGAGVGSAGGTPDVAALSLARANAVLSAWTGARLHAGQAGLVSANDADLALLVGDWCFAHALQALAHEGDLAAIGALASAIGECAVLFAEHPEEPGRLAEIWAVTCRALGVSG